MHPLLSSISRTFFFILQNWNSVPINQPLYSSFYLTPWQSHSTFCPYEFDYSKYLIQYLSFCDWLSWLIIMYSRLIHVVACVRICFLLRLNSHPLYDYITFHLFINQWLLRPFAIANNVGVRWCCFLNFNFQFFTSEYYILISSHLLNRLVPVAFL